MTSNSTKKRSTQWVTCSGDCEPWTDDESGGKNGPVNEEERKLVADTIKGFTSLLPKGDGELRASADVAIGEYVAVRTRKKRVPSKWQKIKQGSRRYMVMSKTQCLVYVFELRRRYVERISGEAVARRGTELVLSGKAGLVDIGFSAAWVLDQRQKHRPDAPVTKKLCGGSASSNVVIDLTGDTEEESSIEDVVVKPHRGSFGVKGKGASSAVDHPGRLTVEISDESGDNEKGSEVSIRRALSAQNSD